MTDNNRLLLELERKIRGINREVINPVFPDLGLDDITPVMESVAKSRAAYLNALFKIVEAAKGNIPTAEHIQKLRALRMTYEEMVAAAQALETAIQRDYLDVKM
jgi:hypothetical protein